MSLLGSSVNRGNPPSRVGESSRFLVRLGLPVSSSARYSRSSGVGETGALETCKALRSTTTFASVRRGTALPVMGLLNTSTATRGTAFFTFLARARKTILRRLYKAGSNVTTSISLACTSLVASVTSEKSTSARWRASPKPPSARVRTSPEPPSASGRASSEPPSMKAQHSGIYRLFHKLYFFFGTRRRRSQSESPSEQHSCVLAAS